MFFFYVISCVGEVHMFDFDQDLSGLILHSVAFYSFVFFQHYQLQKFKHFMSNIHIVKLFIYVIMLVILLNVFCFKGIFIFPNHYDGLLGRR